MTDREMLELAAKAADLTWHDDHIWVDEIAEYVPWNPLKDDGDALRLAVDLSMDVHTSSYVSVRLVDFSVLTVYGNPGDSAAATRRRIVEAAAEFERSAQ